MPDSRIAWAIATSHVDPHLWSHEQHGSPLSILRETVIASQPSQPFTLSREGLWCTWMTVQMGCHVIFCLAKECPYPVGHVFIHFSGMPGVNIAAILDSYVHPNCRRQGVRTKLNECLFLDWKVDLIETLDGSKDGGEAFMRASGYKQDEFGRWTLTREDWEARR